MINKTITCDKCWKDITHLAHCHVVITSQHDGNTMYEFDFCEKCYGNFIRTVGSWLKGENSNE